MSIRVKCGNCKAVLAVGPEAAGRMAECPRCGLRARLADFSEVVRLPLADAAEGELASPGAWNVRLPKTAPERPEQVEAQKLDSGAPAPPVPVLRPEHEDRASLLSDQLAHAVLARRPDSRAKAGAGRRRYGGASGLVKVAAALAVASLVLGVVLATRQPSDARAASRSPIDRLRREPIRLDDVLRDNPLPPASGRESTRSVAEPSTSIDAPALAAAPSIADPAGVPESQREANHEASVAAAATLAEDPADEPALVVPVDLGKPSASVPLPLATAAGGRIRVATVQIEGAAIDPPDGLLRVNQTARIQLTQSPDCWMTIACQPSPTQDADSLLLRLRYEWRASETAAPAPVSLPIVRTQLAKLQRLGQRQQTLAAAMQLEFEAAKNYLAARGPKPLAQKNQAETTVNRLKDAAPAEADRLTQMQQVYTALSAFADKLEALSESGKVVVTSAPSSGDGGLAAASN